jgi:hypothetical protein
VDGKGNREQVKAAFLPGHDRRGGQVGIRRRIRERALHEVKTVFDGKGSIRAEEIAEARGNPGTIGSEAAGGKGGICLALANPAIAQQAVQGSKELHFAEVQLALYAQADLSGSPAGFVGGQIAKGGGGVAIGAIRCSQAKSVTQVDMVFVAKAIEGIMIQQGGFVVKSPIVLRQVGSVQLNPQFMYLGTVARPLGLGFSDQQQKKCAKNSQKKSRCFHIPFNG